MKYLSAADILASHSVIIDKTGGSHGVRDRHAIEMLENLPHQSAFGQELYPTIFLKAALYVRTIVFSHPFTDGNKRTAMAVADVFLQLNGREVNIPRGGVEQFALDVIEKHMDFETIAHWLEKNTRRL